MILTVFGNGKLQDGSARPPANGIGRGHSRSPETDCVPIGLGFYVAGQTVYGFTRGVDLAIDDRLFFKKNRVDWPLAEFQVGAAWNYHLRQRVSEVREFMKKQIDEQTNTKNQKWSSKPVVGLAWPDGSCFIHGRLQTVS